MTEPNSERMVFDRTLIITAICTVQHDEILLFHPFYLLQIELLAELKTILTIFPPLLTTAVCFRFYLLLLLRVFSVMIS